MCQEPYHLICFDPQCFYGYNLVLKMRTSPPLTVKIQEFYDPEVDQGDSPSSCK